MGFNVAFKGLMLITSAYVLRQQMYPASHLYTLSSVATFLLLLVFTTLLK